MGVRSVCAGLRNPRWNRNLCFSNSASACRKVSKALQNVVQTQRSPELILKKLSGFSTARVESMMGASTAPEGPPRFPSPLIKPDVRISRIRLSDWFHRRLTNEGPIGRDAVGELPT